MASKIKILNINHLTHSVDVVKVMGLPLPIKDKPFTIGQMFFQPYKSKEEFEHCALRTSLPLIALELTILAPTVMLGVPVFVVGFALAEAVMGGINTLCGDEKSASFNLDTAEALIKGLCQTMIQMLVVPLAVLIMLTRGISTGLQAAGVYGEHHVTENVPPSSPANA